MKAYEDAENRHDLNAMVAMFTDDAEFELVGRGSFVRKDQIRAIHDYDRGLNTELQFSDCKAEGNTVTCTVVERNDWLRAAGISEIKHPFAVFTFKDDLIQKISSSSPQSPIRR